MNGAWRRTAGASPVKPGDHLLIAHGWAKTLARSALACADQGAGGDFYFKISDPSHGEATVEIANVGKQSHEVGIGKGVKGQGAEVTTMFAPAPEGKMWTALTLEPGDYTLLCFLPDLKTGKPHVKLGMKQSFSVK